jgi:hypothetical protein
MGVQVSCASHEHNPSFGQGGVLELGFLCLLLCNTKETHSGLVLWFWRTVPSMAFKWQICCVRKLLSYRVTMVLPSLDLRISYCSIMNLVSVSYAHVSDVEA